MKKRKIIKRICGVVAVSGFLLVLGTAGASDVGYISIGRIAAQTGAGMMMFVGGAYLGGAFNG